MQASMMCGLAFSDARISPAAFGSLNSRAVAVLYWIISTRAERSSTMVLRSIAIWKGTKKQQERSRTTPLVNVVTSVSFSLNDASRKDFTSTCLHVPIGHDRRHAEQSGADLETRAPRRLDVDDEAHLVPFEPEPGDSPGAAEVLRLADGQDRHGLQLLQVFVQARMFR